MSYEHSQPPDEPSSCDPDDEQQLREVVLGAYRTFRRYKLHDKVDGCPCCVSDSAERELHDTPLADMQGETFGRYVHKAMTTWGDVRDFKHFLPRILELLATDSGTRAWVDAEIAIGKLAYANWSSWPEEEHAAVRAFLHAWWRAQLHRIGEPNDEASVDECLCAIGQAVDDLSPFLEAWRVDGSLSAQLNLARLIHWNCEHLLKKGRLSNAFWSERSAAMRTVIDWLLDPRTKESLEAAFFRNTASQFSEVLSGAVQKWEWISKSAAVKQTL